MKKRAKWKTVASMVCAACLCASMTGCGDTTGDKAKEAENQNKLEIVAEQGHRQPVAQQRPLPPERQPQKQAQLLLAQEKVSRVMEQT